MQNSEIRALKEEELTAKLEEAKDNYQKLKFAHTITPIVNPISIKENRRLIARLNTEIRKRSLDK